MELIVYDHFGIIPENIKELTARYTECKWLDEYEEAKLVNAIAKALGGDKK